ncbi:hypothetical protein GCM10027275_20640 [Rhabdobacter roseus]|uniref:Lipoprotein n=1 Tax=Rhabdobacter roseus TaxID=1655419 RepID=A0A840TM41_9BACT|nr:hypothetical protein [Rhabdobacter roseus]MBB5283995.1 hypothetical protein [Rhabdobacter roseus]
MKNNRNSWLLLLLLGLAGCSSSKVVPYESKWNAPFSYVDEVKPDRQDQRSRLQYGIINDDQYLYITLKARDPQTVQQIITNGLRLSFSPAGKRGGATSLLFPVVTRDDKKALRRMDVDLPNSLGMARMLEAFNKEAIWKDQRGERFINLVNGSTGIRSHIALADGELTEQISIPFAMLGFNPQQVASLDMGIKVEGTSSQGGGISPRVSIGMGGMGMGGMGMGGGGVGVGVGGGGRNNPNDRAVDIRLQVRLARSDFGG